VWWANECRGRTRRELKDFEINWDDNIIQIKLVGHEIKISVGLRL